MKDNEIGGAFSADEMRNAYKMLVGKFERDHLEDLDINGRIIIKRGSRVYRLD
jgi:hypothetical protein